MNDNKRNEQIKALVNLIFVEVSAAILATDKDKSAQHLAKIADYEVRLNRILYSENFETFVA